MIESMQRLFIYVDETGQDTLGKFFLVSIVITDRERESLRGTLEEIEDKSGKGKVKWISAKKNARFAYIRKVLKITRLWGKLYYAIYKNGKNYFPLTVLTTARAITKHAEERYKATIFVDGLPRSKEKWFGAELRHLRIQTKKIRGVKKEESNALIRLADAVCGFVRAATEGEAIAQKLFKQAKKQGVLIEL